MKLVPQGLTRAVGRQVLVAKKNSPHIFFVGGVIGAVGSTIMACRATLKLEETVDEIRNDIANVKEIRSDPDPKSNYPENQYGRDLSYVYVKSAIKVGRLYGPSVVLGVASIGALTGSHIQLTRRNTALTATLAAVTKAYDEYRLRVQDEIGAEKELDIYHNVKEVKGEDGKSKIKVPESPFGSPYNRFFDECSREFVKSADYNRSYLHAQQNWWNQRLQAWGHVFLNEVYDGLGFERTEAGAIVGWVLDGDGDGFIDFGLFDPINERFMQGNERVAYLNFNVDGPIFQKIEKK